MGKLEIVTIEISMDIKKMEQLQCKDLLWCRGTSVNAADLFKGKTLIGKIYQTPSFIKNHISEKTECKVVDINIDKRKVKLQFGGLDEFYYLGQILDIQKFANKMTNGNLDIAKELIKSLKEAGEIINPENRKLFFANQQYTLQEFANKMTKGDINSAETVLENLIKSGSAKWIDSEINTQIQSNNTYESENRIYTNTDSSSKSILSTDKHSISEEFDLYFRQGVEEKRRGNYNQALKKYDLAKNLSAHNMVKDIHLYDLYKAYGKLYYIMGEYKKSVDNYVRSINYLIRAGVKREQLLLNDPNILRHLGYALLELKGHQVSERIGVARYRKTIDPFYTNNTVISLGEGTLGELDKKCTKLGCKQVNVPWMENSLMGGVATSETFIIKNPKTSQIIDKKIINQKSSVTYTERKLDFCGQMYTLEKFASEFCDKDTNQAKKVIETLIKQGRANWVNTQVQSNRPVKANSQAYVESQEKYGDSGFNYNAYGDYEADGGYDAYGYDEDMNGAYD